ncbi:caspase family protein [Ekhidna sp.]|jgi:WD40 repeat protein|uniref:caspase family protein n=1 Tax=Ekhidna sp. TaxID=2608089 RepID=UPI0032EE4846
MNRTFSIIFFLCSLQLSAQQIFIEPVAKLTSSLDRVTAVSFSSDAEMMIAGDRKGNFQVWDLNELRPVTNNKVGDEIIFVDFLSDNDEILIVDEDGGLHFFSTSNFQKTRFVSLGEIPELVSVDPEKQYLSYVNKNDELKVFSLRAQMQQAQIRLGDRISKPIYLGYDRFGQQLAVMGQDGTTLMCNPVNQNVLREVKLRSNEFAGSSSVMHAGASNKGSDLFVTGVQEVFIPKGGVRGGQPERRNSIIAYDWDSSNEVKRIRVNDRVDEIVLGPGPAHIAYYTDKRYRVTLVDLEQGATSSEVTLDEFPEVIEISPEDSYLAAGDKNGTIHLFELQRNAAPQIRITKPPLNRNLAESVVQESTVEMQGVLSDGSKIKQVMVNGKEAEILANGKFTAQLDLLPGKNRIRVLAQDYQSNTAFKDFYITHVPQVELSASGNVDYSNQKRVALVIGNADYAGAGALNNTVNDANAMAQTLKEMGFEVTDVINGSYEEMKRAVYRYGTAIRDVDVSVFFYAGHGLEIDGVNYLVPVNADISSPLDVKLKTLPLTGVLRTIEYANDDGLNMIILDACRNNPFPTGKRGGAGLAKETPPSGTLIAYSTGPGNVASDGDGENGLYTGELIKQMKKPQRIEDVFMRTRNSVEEISNGAQQPWEEARLKGIFYLKY